MDLPNRNRLTQDIARKYRILADYLQSTNQFIGIDVLQIIKLIESGDYNSANIRLNILGASQSYLTNPLNTIYSNQRKTLIRVLVGCVKISYLNLLQDLLRQEMESCALTTKISTNDSIFQSIDRGLNTGVNVITDILFFATEILSEAELSRVNLEDIIQRLAFELEIEAMGDLREALDPRNISSNIYLDLGDYTVKVVPQSSLSYLLIASLHKKTLIKKMISTGFYDYLIQIFQNENHRGLSYEEFSGNLQKTIARLSGFFLFHPDCNIENMTDNLDVDIYNKFIELTSKPNFLIDNISSEGEIINGSALDKLINSVPFKIPKILSKLGRIGCPAAFNDTLSQFSLWSKNLLDTVYKHREYLQQLQSVVSKTCPTIDT